MKVLFSDKIFGSEFSSDLHILSVCVLACVYVCVCNCVGEHPVLYNSKTTNDRNTKILYTVPVKCTDSNSNNDNFQILVKIDVLEVR